MIDLLEKKQVEHLFWAYGGDMEICAFNYYAAVKTAFYKDIIFIETNSNDELKYQSYLAVKSTDLARLVDNIFNKLQHLLKTRPLTRREAEFDGYFLPDEDGKYEHVSMDDLIWINTAQRFYKLSDYKLWQSRLDKLE